MGLCASSLAGPCGRADADAPASSQLKSEPSLQGGKIFVLQVDAGFKATEARHKPSADFPPIAAAPPQCQVSPVPPLRSTQQPLSIRSSRSGSGSGSSVNHQAPLSGMSTRARRLSLPGTAAAVSPTLDAVPSGSTPPSSSEPSTHGSGGARPATPPEAPVPLPTASHPVLELLERYGSPIKTYNKLWRQQQQLERGHDIGADASAALSPAEVEAAAAAARALRRAASLSGSQSPAKPAPQAAAAAAAVPTNSLQASPVRRPSGSLASSLTDELLHQRRSATGGATSATASPSKAQAAAAVPMSDLIHSVASLSRAGREPTYRKQNQDNCFAYQQYIRPNQALLAALDGHGPHGHMVSGYLKKQVPLALAEQLGEGGSSGSSSGSGTTPGSSAAPGGGTKCGDAATALTATFLGVHADLEGGTAGVNCQYSGSTAVVCMLQGRRLTTAWVGDSKAVLVRQDPRGCRAICLTRDHKPNQPDERARIESRGGRVERLVDQRGQPVGPQRVWLSSSWVPGLAMSRALGDLVANSVGVSAEPETSVVEVCAQDKFLVLATDGVWEFIDPQTAVEIVSGCRDAEEACRTLVDSAWTKWLQEEEGVVDDITVVCIKFKPC